MDKIKKEMFEAYIKSGINALLLEDVKSDAFKNSVIIESNCDVSLLNGHYENEKFVAPAWYLDLVNNNKNLLIIDNINDVSEYEQGKFVEILRYRKVSTFDSYKVKPVFNAKQTGKVFKMHAGIKLTKADKSANMVFESVRREEDWEKKIIDRMKLLKDFYENFVQFDSGYETKPQLVLLCEDDKHTIETFRIIVTNNLEISNAKIYFTTDLRQNNTSLSSSLTEFVMDEETGKYKIQELNLKILE